MRGGENIVKAAVDAFVRAQSESGSQLIKMEMCKTCHMAKANTLTS